MACELAETLPPASSPAFVVPTAVETSLPAERLDQLAARFSSLLAGAIGPEARVAPDGVTDRTLKQQIGRGWRVIRVRAELRADRFSVVAEQLSSIPRFWERVRGLAPVVGAHAFAVRPLDAELRSFLPPVPLVLSRVDRIEPLGEPILALACGDADADGSAEIVGVGRQRVLIGRIRRNRFVIEKALAWRDLSQVAPTPLREPIASAVLRTPGNLEVGLSDRAQAVRLDASFRVSARYSGRIPWPGSSCSRLSSIGLGPAPVRCEEPEARQTDPANPTVDAIAGMLVQGSSMEPQELIARRRQQDRRLELRVGTRWIALDEVAGAQIALGDLNGDGAPELVSSNDTRDAKLDFVRVRTLRKDGRTEEAFRLPVPSGVLAVAICPLRAAELSPIVVATGDGLWLLR